MPVYADTSFLCFYFLPDANSGLALATVQSLGGPLVFTALHRLELKNAFALAVFRGRISSPQTAAAWQDVAPDLRAGRLFPTRLNWYAALRQSAILSAQQTPATGCRSLDVLHVAAARQLGAQEFLSFDSRQRALAQLLGFVVRP